MAQLFEHCKLVGTQIVYLGRVGVFEDKGDRSANEAAAWDKLEKDGWELVTVVTDSDGRLVPYFKRATGAGKK
jgi:hypothetical protein